MSKEHGMDSQPRLTGGNFAITTLTYQNAEFRVWAMKCSHWLKPMEQYQQVEQTNQQPTAWEFWEMSLGFWNLGF